MQRKNVGVFLEPRHGAKSCIENAAPVMRNNSFRPRIRPRIVERTFQISSRFSWLPLWSHKFCSDSLAEDTFDTMSSAKRGSHKSLLGAGRRHRLVASERVLQQTSELPAKDVHEQKVGRTVQHHQYVQYGGVDLQPDVPVDVNGVQNKPGQRLRLADEEDENNAERQHGRLHLPLAASVELFPLLPRFAHVIHDAEVENGEYGERQQVDGEAVQGSVVKVSVDNVIAEIGAPDLHEGLVVLRLEDVNRGVLEELGHVEEDSENHDQQDGEANFAKGPPVRGLKHEKISYEEMLSLSLTTSAENRASRVATNSHNQTICFSLGVR